MVLPPLPPVTLFFLPSNAPELTSITLPASSWMSPLLRTETEPPFKYGMPAVCSGDIARFVHMPRVSRRLRLLNVTFGCSATPEKVSTAPVAEN